MRGCRFWIMLCAPESNVRQRQSKKKGGLDVIMKNCAKQKQYICPINHNIEQRNILSI